MRPLAYLKYFALFAVFLPFLGGCFGAYEKMGLETPGIGENDQIILEMTGDVKLTYTKKDDQEVSKPLTEDSLSFSIVNVKPNEPGKSLASFTALFVRPQEDSFSKPGLKLHQGVDHCTRDENGDPVVALADTSAFNTGIQPHLKIGSEDIELKVAPLLISGTIEGVRVMREDGNSTFYDKAKLLSEITYQNPGSIGECKLTKNVIMGTAVNSPVGFKLVNKNAKAVTSTGEATTPTGSGATGNTGSGSSKEAAAAGGCSLLAGGAQSLLSGSAIFWGGAFLMGAWQFRPRRKK